MSELTRCNYCVFELLKNKYGNNLITSNEPLSEHKFPSGITIKEKMPDDTERFLVWFMFLPDRCCC